MDTLGILKFWRNAASAADVSSDCGDVRNAVLGTDDDESDGEDSFFDLVLKSPDDSNKAGVSRKDFPFIESPRDVFLSRNEISISKPSSRVTLLRSTKFKVFTLGFRKSSKCESDAGELKSSPLNQILRSSKMEQSNRFKYRMEEAPIASVFARDNSLRSKLLKENAEYEASHDVVSSGKSVHKYLKLIKPLYIKNSKKTKLTESITPSSSPVTVPVNLSPRKISESSRVGSFKIVTRNLGKSRSASAVVGIPQPQPPLRRRDYSLLEQHDGIQGAILHCKKSYNSSSQEISQLFRSASDPTHEIKLRPPCRNSYEEQKRCSI